MATNMLITMSATTIMFVVNLIVGGKFVFKIGEFAVKSCFAILLCAAAIRMADTEFAELMCSGGQLWSLAVIMISIAMFIVVGDLFRYLSKDQTTRGSRRSTPVDS